MYPLHILQTVQGHEDLVKLDDAQRQQLCRELRQTLVDTVSKTGGHLASNLGVVELTVALETVFETKVDRLVFDVGHQSYVHKLLTGRQAAFSTLRSFGGLSCFPQPSESDTDAFVAGHASSAVSIALGMARARTLQGQSHSVVALLGDGAATGGMVYEALNDAAESGEPLVIVLNDNEMSIDRNVGGMARHLGRLRTKAGYLGAKRRYRRIMEKLPGGRAVYRASSRVKDWVRRVLIPNTIFENMGLTYLGPVDGHDLPRLISLLENARTMGVPVLVHVLTQKGRGYAPAEEHPKQFHGVGRFDAVTGTVPEKLGPSFSGAFGYAMCALAKKHENLCAITAAMPGGTGLLPFKKQFPKRLFDVGIAEEHALSMAGGLAKAGMVPVVALYSTFLQRGYDMLQQDVGLLGLHVVLAVDRAGLVGEDGQTHHGVYDVGFLRQIPRMTLLAPATTGELETMLAWAVEECTGPVALRYSRGGDRWDAPPLWVRQGVACHREGPDGVLITYGTLVANCMAAAALLEEQGISLTVLRLQCLAPLPDLCGCLRAAPWVLVCEEVCTGSGLREALAWACPDLPFYGKDLGDLPVTHGSLEALYRQTGLDGPALAQYIREELAHGS